MNASRLCTTAIVAAVAVYAAGCGSSQTTGDTARDARIAAAISAPGLYCISVITGGQIEGYDDAAQGVDDLIAVARETPDYRYSDTDDSGATRSRTMRQILTDEVTRMQTCDPALADRLARAIETL